MEKDVKEALQKTKVVAIIRGMAPDVCVRLAKAYQEGGIRLVEVAFSQVGDSAATVSAIKAIKASCPGMHVGAGTVITDAQLDMAVEAGAEFVVSPNCSPAIIRRAAAAGLVTMPGALTPTEAVDAWEAGASFVKMFPAGSLGPGYVKAICAPLSHIPFLAVGGISPDNVGDFIRAGCVGAGVGGNLTNKEWIASESWDKIAETARQLVANAKCK